MTFQPPPRHPVQLPIVTPFGEEMAALSRMARSAPASGTWGTASRAYFFPLYLEEPFVVAKAFWCNGATAATDFIDIGIYVMTDLVTGRLDLIRSTGRVLAAGVSVVQAASVWKVALFNLMNGVDATDLATYTTASVTMKVGRLYLMTVTNTHGTSATAVSAITSGPTFTSRSTTQFNTNLNRVSIWSAVPTVDYTGTLSIAFGGTTQTGACWTLEEASGVDTATADGIVQQAVGTGNSGTSLATLAAFGSANNATYQASAHVGSTAVAPGAGFTELVDSGYVTAPAQSIHTEWQVGNDTTADSTFTSAQWGACAVEVKASADPFVIPASAPGSPRIYMGMSVSGTTTTLLRQTSSVGFAATQGALAMNGTFPLPPSIIPTGLMTTLNPVIPLAGFSNRTLLE